MARDRDANGKNSQERDEALAKAINEAQINFNELMRVLPRESNIPKTKIRRHSIDQVLFQTFETADAAGTLDNDSDAGLQGPTGDTLPSYENFKTHIVEQLENGAYSYTINDLKDDLQLKCDALATLYTKDDQVAFPLASVFANSPDFNPSGLIGHEAFLTLVEKFPSEMFAELKGRAILCNGLYQLVLEVHSCARGINSNCNVMVDWVHEMAKNGAFGSGGATTESGVPAEQYDELLAQVDLLEKEVEGDNGIIAEITKENKQMAQTIRELKAAAAKVTTTKVTANPSTPIPRDTRLGTPFDPAALTVSSDLTNRTAVTSGTASNKKSSKIDGPDTWYGDPAKDTVKFEAWYRNLQNKLIVNADHYDNDRAKMAYIEGRLRGNASAALMPYLSLEHPERISDTAQLLEWLYHEYHDHTAKRQAKRDYEALQMKPSDEFQTFKNEFVRLAGSRHLPKGDWKEELHAKITPALRDLLTVSYVNEAVDFNEYCRLASEYAMNKKVNYERRQAASAARATSTPDTTNENRGRNSNNRAVGSSRSSSTPSGTTSTTTTGSSTPTSYKRPNAQEIKQLVAEGRCFICREKGHITKDCPKKESTPGYSPRTRVANMDAIVEKYAGKDEEEKSNSTN